MFGSVGTTWGCLVLLEVLDVSAEQITKVEAQVLASPRSLTEHEF